MASIIYLIFDAETLAPLYVGKSDRKTGVRFNEHLKFYRDYHGLKISQIVLEEVIESWEIREKYWIAWFRDFCKLDNKQPGGNQFPANASKLGGINGGRIGGLAGKGKRKPGLSKFMLGRKRPDISAKLKGKKFSDIHRQRLSEAAFKRERLPITNTQKTLISRALKGREFSDVHKKKLSLFVFNYWVEVKQIQAELNCSIKEARRLRSMRKAI